MNWNAIYEAPEAPDAAVLSAFVSHPLWDALAAWLEEAYGCQPSMVHSRCAMGPGWNVKYRAGGGALCTLYPTPGAFTCLIVIGGRLAAEREALVPALSPYTRSVWADSPPASNGTRWLSLEVSSPEVLEDIKILLSWKKAPKRS